MAYSSFAVITDTPARLTSFLQARGIIQQTTDPVTGQQQWTGVRPGMEWIEVPNPIQTGVDGSGNPVMDTRHVYLVKFSRESLDADNDGTIDEDVWNFSKFAKWVKNNSTVVTAPVGWTINGQSVGDAYKINGQNVWLVRNSPERFGVWQ